MKTVGKIAIGSVVAIVVGSIMVGTSFAIGGLEAINVHVPDPTTRTVDIEDDFSNIVIDVSSEDVVFTHTSEGSCRVELVEYEDECTNDVTVEGDTLTITSHESDIRNFSIFIGYHAPRVTVYLPDDEYADVDIDINTGDFTVESGFTFDSIDVNLTTGDIDIKDAVVSGDINVLGTTVDSTFDNVTCINLIYNVVTGDIDLADFIASEDISIDITTGDVVFDGSDAFNIQIDLTTGDVSGTLRTAKSFDVDIVTGDVSIPRDGNGGNCTISITTGDVDIDVDN